MLRPAVVASAPFDELGGLLRGVRACHERLELAPHQKEHVVFGSDQPALNQSVIELPVDAARTIEPMDDEVLHGLALDEAGAGAPDQLPQPQSPPRAQRVEPSHGVLVR
ncbi:MAG: hypothetical protein JRJ64_14200 [Deltaproteobacteria bacterium]|nr:hypothetical protein [Deltaproteobacteria bacterium]